LLRLLTAGYGTKEPSSECLPTSVDWGAADSLTIGSLAKQRGVQLDREHLECSKTVYINTPQFVCWGLSFGPGNFQAESSPHTLQPLPQGGPGWSSYASVATARRLGLGPPGTPPFRKYYPLHR
jgi:hypothetical protein